MLNKNNFFIGCGAGWNEAKAVVFGAPFDGTTTYRPGARFAYRRMREESFGIETYSPYFDRDLGDIAAHDAGELELPFGVAAKALKQIELYTAKVIKSGKIPFMIGGEHLVTLGAVRAAAAAYPNLHVLHFDAHADLRDEYLGEKLSHSTVMRRIHELTGDKRIFQFGIRSGERGEFLFAREHTYLTQNSFNGIEKAAETIGSAPVYLSVDLDVLDPSEFPATGTPEAGGVRYTELIGAIAAASRLNIVACDITELCPPYDVSGISTALACKLLRELLLSVTK